MDDREMMVTRGIENLQREDLTPNEEAKVYRRMMDEGGMSRGDVARRTGKNFHTIDKYLYFLKLPICVQDALHRRHISMDVAKALGEFDDDATCLYYTNMAVDNGVTAPVIRLWVEDYFKSKQGTFYDSIPPDPLASPASEPSKQYTACNVCQDPVEIVKVFHLLICPKCRELVRTLRRST
jgi:hypothetical protein